MAIHRTQSSEIISRESESESVVSSTGTIVHHNINDAAIVIRDADGDALYLSPTVRAANTIFNRTLPSDENLQYQATTSEEADPTKDSRVDSGYNGTPSPTNNNNNNNNHKHDSSHTVTSNVGGTARTDRSSSPRHLTVYDSGYPTALEAVLVDAGYLAHQRPVASNLVKVNGVPVHWSVLEFEDLPLAPFIEAGYLDVGRTAPPGLPLPQVCPVADIGLRRRRFRCRSFTLTDGYKFDDPHAVSSLAPNAWEGPISHWTGYFFPKCRSEALAGLWALSQAPLLPYISCVGGEASHQASYIIMIAQLHIEGKYRALPVDYDAADMVGSGQHVAADAALSTEKRCLEINNDDDEESYYDIAYEEPVEHGEERYDEITTGLEEDKGNYEMLSEESGCSDEDEESFIVEEVAEAVTMQRVINQNHQVLQSWGPDHISEEEMQWYLWQRLCCRVYDWMDEVDDGPESVTERLKEQDLADQMDEILDID
jgi:hypothetical protein